MLRCQIFGRYIWKTFEDFMTAGKKNPGKIRISVSALIQEFKPQQELPLVVATDWVVMARNPEKLASLSQSLIGNWQKMPLYFDMKPWTDDFTNIVSIWK